MLLLTQCNFSVIFVDQQKGKVMGILQEIGVNAGLVVSGLFGSLLTISKGTSAKLGSIILSIAAGVGSANYITPIVVDTLNVQGKHYTFGIAFILGFLGLKGIDAAIQKFFPKVVEQPTPRKVNRRNVRRTPKKVTSQSKKRRT
jgi:hypothetical protein